MRSLGFLALLFCSAIAAQPTQEHLMAARQLVALMDYRAMFDAYLVQCQSPSGSYLDPNAIFKSDPGSFMGLSPQSAYWPEVEASFKKYQANACAYLSADEFSEYVASQYSARASLEDLQASIAFQSSPAGRRLQQASVATNEAFQTYAQSTMRRVVLQAYEQAQVELRAIAGRYRREPR